MDMATVSITSAQARKFGLLKIAPGSSKNHAASTRSNIGKGRMVAESIREWCVKACNYPRPELEHRFHPTRLWKFDLAWPAFKLAIEIQGGNWSANGAHGFGSKFEDDCEKIAEAVLLGWRVMPVTHRQVISGKVHEWLTREFKGAIRCAPTGGKR